MKIQTSFEYPPIPDRRFDWSAVDDDTYDGEGCPIGRGPTERDAVMDLLNQMEDNLDEDEDGSELAHLRVAWTMTP